MADSPACAHCGLPSPVPAAGDEAFCCAGCRQARALLRGAGLTGGWDRIAKDAVAVAPAASAPEPGLERHARRRDDGLRTMRWRIQGMHCPACVWLVERLPRLQPGVVAARVDAGRGELTVVDDPARCALADHVAALAPFGYRLRPAGAAGLGAGSERRDLIARVAVAAAASMGAMHLATTLAAGELAGDLDATGRWAYGAGALAAAAPALFWAAAPIWRSGWAQIRARVWGVDALAAGALLVAAAASVAGLGGTATYADAAALFACLLLVARLVQHEARERIRRQASDLDGLLPRSVERLAPEPGLVAPGDLRPGDRIRVPAGGIIPADGAAVGRALVDRSILTGEATALTVDAGDEVLAGSRAHSPLDCTVAATGEGTRLAMILAAAVAGRRGPGPLDRWMPWFTVVVVAVAALTAVAWWPHGPAAAIAPAVAVLVVSCPCALAIAAPLLQAAVAGRLAAAGILLRDPGALDRLARLRGVAVVLDKTGTVTAGEPAVEAFTPMPGPWSAEELRRWAGALAAGSLHPAARALAIADPPPVAGRTEHPGLGLEGVVEGHRLRLGRPGWLGLADDGGQVALAVDGLPAATVRLADPLRPGASALVARLRAAGAEPWLASGDHPAAVAAAAGALGIPAGRTRARCLPADKRALVAELGRAVVIGDGINDGPALAAAEVGIAVRGSLASALEQVAVFAAGGDPVRDVGALLDAATAYRRRLRLLVAVALGYNVLAVAAAAAGWFGPLVCAAVMPLSSATVAVLALAGRRETD
jgi:Cu2+-exporting ATPase